MARSARERAVWVDVDLGAVRHNVGMLAERAAPASVLAVVKANAYGHGAVPVARAALAGGATWLGVARVEEGVELRRAGIEAPVLVLSEAPASATAELVGNELTPMVAGEAAIDALAKAVVESARRSPLPIHVKVDTGMHRVGCPPERAVDVVAHATARDELVVEAVCTHLAVADAPDDPYTAAQLDRFDEVLAALEARGLRPKLAHAANSAATLAVPRSHYDLVRVGIACYGLPPAPALADIAELRPALSLRSRVTQVQDLPAGERVSYGLRYELGSAARVATVSAGYADGVPRNLGLVGGEVLVRGERRPIAGVVTMDQLMVDVGDAPVEPGDDVVLLGMQGGEEITATEWAERLGTINYEIVTGIGARVERTYAE